MVINKLMVINGNIEDNRFNAGNIPHSLTEKLEYLLVEIYHKIFLLK